MEAKENPPHLTCLTCHDFTLHDASSDPLTTECIQQTKSNTGKGVFPRYDFFLHVPRTGKQDSAKVRMNASMRFSVDIVISHHQHCCTSRLEQDGCCEKLNDFKIDVAKTCEPKQNVPEDS